MHFKSWLLLAFFGMFLTACTSTIPESQPLPELTFDQMNTLAIDVANVEIRNNYDPNARQADVSTTFPTPPDVALRRYADNRLQEAGQTGTLHFVIEDVMTRSEVRQPEGAMNEWLGLNKKDYYEVSIKLRLYEVTAPGRQSEHAIININRWISIPQRYSLSRKEQEKFAFMEMLMKDVDKAVKKALDSELGLLKMEAASI